MKNNKAVIAALAVGILIGSLFFQNCAGNYNPGNYTSDNSSVNPPVTPAAQDCSVAANTSWTDSTGKISCSISKATTITNGQSKTISADSTNTGSIGYLCSNGVATIVTASNTCAVPFIAAPVITTQPVATLTVGVGAPINLSVVATGSGLTYMWSKTVNGVKTDIANTNTPNFTIASAALTDSGSYTVSIINGGGSVVSTAAVVTVSGPKWVFVANSPTGAPQGAPTTYDPTCSLGYIYAGASSSLIGTNCTVKGTYCYDQLNTFTDVMFGAVTYTWDLLNCQ